MLKISGRLSDGVSGFLEIVDDTVVLWAERGIISKELVKLTEFPISEATLTQLERYQTPFRQTHKLTIKYGTETGESEALFFSDDEPSLVAVKTEVDRDIERRRFAQERELAEQRRLREAHVHQITLILELLDQIFKIVFELDDSVNWSLMKRHLSETERILREMKEVDLDIPISYDVRGLATSLRRRQTDDIKEGCYALIEAVHDDIEKISDTPKPPKVFNLDLYELFVKSYLLTWDLNLGEYVGDSIDKDELDALQASLEKLDGLVQSDDCSAGFKQTKDLSSMKTISPHFENIRSLIRICLNSLIE